MGGGTRFLKHFFNGGNNAGELIGYFYKDGFRLTGLYEIHGDINGAPGLKWYVGPGAHIGFYDAGYMHRGYPLLQQPFQLLNALLEIDEQLSSWRYRHMNMVHRMIGTRIGTGGSSGKDYLKAAADKHYIFREIAQLNSFLIERRKLPALSPEMEWRLGFHR